MVTKKGLFELLTSDLKVINENEANFEIPLAEDHELDDIKEGFEPFHRLREFAFLFNQNQDDWMKSFKMLSKSKIEREIN